MLIPDEEVYDLAPEGLGVMETLQWVSFLHTALKDSDLVHYFLGLQGYSAEEAHDNQVIMMEFVSWTTERVWAKIRTAKYN